MDCLLKSLPSFAGPSRQAKNWMMMGTSVIVQCPWHGFRFDIKTRNCTSGAHCRLAPAPVILDDKASGELWATRSES